ncbi:MAG: ester cyclase [Actinobacteria bacterium]|nr:ester cyclase [Actinomycetota bacterium]
MSNQERVRRYWESFWSRGDTAAVDELYASTFRLNGHEVRRGEWLEEAVMWRSCFRDLSATVDLLVASGESLVVSRVLYSGTFERETYRGLSPRGRLIEISGIDIFRFEDGRVVDHWHEADHHTMFAQLGAELRPAE